MYSICVKIFGNELFQQPAARKVSYNNLILNLTLKIDLAWIMGGIAIIPRRFKHYEHTASKSLYLAKGRIVL